MDREGAYGRIVGSGGARSAGAPPRRSDRRRRPARGDTGGVRQRAQPAAGLGGSIRVPEKGLPLQNMPSAASAVGSGTGAASRISSFTRIAARRIGKR